MKPCPFCGSQGRSISMSGNQFYAIQCSTCSAQSGWNRSERGALTLWEQRAEQELAHAVLAVRVLTMDEGLLVHGVDWHRVEKIARALVGE
jgi:Lar family restriction alleviation protein